MRLVFYELKKLSGQRLIVWLLIILLVANAVIAYSFTERDDTFFYLEKIFDDYENNPSAVEEYFKKLDSYDDDYASLLWAYLHGELSEEPTLNYPYTYSGVPEVDDYILLKTFFDTLDNEKVFEEKIGAEIKRAEINKLELLTSYDGIDEDSYAYRKQVLIGNTYSAVRDNVTPLSGMSYGWNQFFDYDAVNVFIAILVCLGTAYIFMSEKGNAALVLHTTKRGRTATGVAKTASALLWSAFVVIAFLLSTLWAVALKCGAMSNVNNYAALFESLTLLPYPLTVLEYFLVFICTKLILFSAVAAICSLLCLLLRNMTFGFLLTLTLLGANYLIYITAGNEAFKYLNFAGYACNSAMLAVVRPVNLFGFAVAVFPLMTAIIIILLLICSVVAVRLFATLRLGTVNVSASRFRIFVAKCSAFLQRRKKPAKKAGSTHIFTYEIYKLVSSRFTVLLLIAVLICGVFMTADTYKKNNSYQMMLYNEYIEKLRGEQTDEKSEYIEAEYARINSTIADFTGKRTDFFTGKLSYDEYSVFLKEYAYAGERIEVIEKLKNHSEYLNHIYDEYGIDACYLYDIDWERVTSESINPLLIIIVAIVASGIFADEYGRASTVDIIRATKHGRKKLFGAKLAFSALTAFVFSAFFAAVEFAFVFRNLRLPDGNFPLASLEIFGDTAADMTILQYLIICTVMRIILLVAVSIAVTATGALIKNKLYTLAAVFFVIFAPNIISRLGISQLGYADITSALDFTKLYLTSTQLGGFTYMTLFLLALFAACTALVIMAERRYCRTNAYCK